MKNNIRKIAKEKKMTMNEVIEKSTMSKSQVHDIASGEFTPSVENARKIADALKSTIDQVFPRDKKGENSGS